MAPLPSPRHPAISSIPEQALDARRAAVDEVEKLLQHPEDLNRLPGLVDEYTQKYQANKAHLSATVASQVDAARTGTDLLASAQRSLCKMRESYKVIDMLCTECSSLIDHHEKIQVLAGVHYKLGKTLQDVENIMALPAEAAAAEQMLRDDNQLLQAYETLTILEGTSSMAQQALQANGKLKREDTYNLNAYFNKVRETLTKFEERVWSIIRNCVRLGHENPGLLLTAARIICLQETVDSHLNASGTGTVKPKRYRQRAQQQIGNGIQDNFAPLLQACSQLAAAGENTDQRTNAILDQAHEFVMQLADIYDYVTPCFPPEYHIFDVIFHQYHEHLAFMVDCIGACAEQLANSDILKVMSWIGSYQDALRELGVAEEEVSFPSQAGRGSSLLMATYTHRMKASLTTWYTNILEADLTSSPKQAEDGKLWTPGAVEFFRIVNEQVALVEEATNGEMLALEGAAVLAVMKDFQEAQQRALGRKLSDEVLCALINNNMRCYTESMEFAEHLEDVLADPYKGTLDIEAQCRGFLDLCKAAVAVLIDSIFSDPAFMDLFQKLYCSEEWKSGAVTQSIVATLQDYFNDFEKLIDSFYFKRAAEACLELTIAHFIAAMLTYTKAIDDDFLDVAHKDHRALVGFFERICPKEKVARAAQPLEDLREVAGSDSVDTFVLSYTSLLQVAPAVIPSLLEKIVAGRSDLTKADVKEVMEQCRDVYLQRQKALGDTTPLPPKPAKAAPTSTAFRVALAAAKQRVGGAGSPTK